MKKIFLATCLLAFTVFAYAQLKGVLDRAKQKAENKAKEKANKKTDDSVDSAFSKTEKTERIIPINKIKTLKEITSLNQIRTQHSLPLFPSRPTANMILCLVKSDRL